MLDDSTEEERKEALEVILGQSKKMSLLVSQLLAMSRSEHESRNARYERTNLTKVMESVSAELKGKAKEKNIEIKAVCEQEVYINEE
jgi:signal transduction histidine kinase